jgi:hypothetical protein
MIIISCPIIFTIITNALNNKNNFSTFNIYMVTTLLISLLTYSLCFFCNTLLRKTARAWLAGMTVTGFFLLSPFILPIGLTDIVQGTLLWISGIYMATLIAITILCYILSILTVKFNWQIQSNFKAMLWSGAALFFGLGLFVNTQVANIKVLDQLHARTFSDT